jgi:hypothetical protein
MEVLSTLTDELKNLYPSDSSSSSSFALPWATFMHWIMYVDNWQLFYFGLMQGKIKVSQSKISPSLTT